MASTTVRISMETIESLRELADQLEEPMQKVLSRAVEAYRRHYILEKSNAAYAALRANPERWQQEREERQEWDVTLADGVEEE